MKAGEAIEVRCPKCKAEPGDPCVTRSGMREYPAPGPHTARFDAACDHGLSRLRGVNGSHLTCGCGRRWKLSPSEADRFRRAIEEVRADAKRDRARETA
jgi:hypothetical protein